MLPDVCACVFSFGQWAAFGSPLPEAEDVSESCRNTTERSMRSIMPRTVRYAS